MPFSRGLRPYMAVMSQKSQSNGQPREYWSMREAYFPMSTRSQRGTGDSLNAGKDEARYTLPGMAFLQDLSGKRGSVTSASSRDR